MIAVIMIPNIIFTIRCKEGFENKWSNKYVEVTEQVGRLGCFGFMIINIPGTWFGWWSDEAFAIYLIVDTILVVLYCAIWIICFKKSSIFRALALSVIPSVLFLFSGIMSRSILLLIAAILFAPSHILLSYKNAKWYWLNSAFPAYGSLSTGCRICYSEDFHLHICHDERLQIQWRQKGMKVL